VIETVLGPVDASVIGRVDMHEHVLSDAGRLRRDGVEPTPEQDRVTPSLMGYLRWNALGMADNLRLDDETTAVDELGPAGRGVDLVVEATSVGLGPRHHRLPHISRRAGVAVAVSYGLYVEPVLPRWAVDLGEAACEEHLHGALTDHVPGADYRAALLGIMGTSGDVSAHDRVRLRAAARAAARAGAAVTVRLDPDRRAGLKAVETMTAEGLPPERVVFTNADEFMDAAYWAELSAAGVVLEMCFGTEVQHVGRMENPSDGQRLSFFVDFLADHPASRHTLGASTWTKSQLRRFGGPGYDHLSTRVVPELSRRGVPDERIEAMFAAEPRRLLDR
jgi:phosphotriesterase-related protein